MDLNKNIRSFLFFGPIKVPGARFITGLDRIKSVLVLSTFFSKFLVLSTFGERIWVLGRFLWVLRTLNLWTHRSVWQVCRASKKGQFHHIFGMDVKCPYPIAYNHSLTAPFYTHQYICRICNPGLYSRVYDGSLKNSRIRSPDLLYTLPISCR